MRMRRRSPFGSHFQAGFPIASVFICKHLCPESAPEEQIREIAPASGTRRAIRRAHETCLFGVGHKVNGRWLKAALARGGSGKVIRFSGSDRTMKRIPPRAVGRAGNLGEIFCEMLSSRGLQSRAGLLASARD